MEKAGTGPGREAGEKFSWRSWPLARLCGRCRRGLEREAEFWEPEQGLAGSRGPQRGSIRQKLR